MGKILVIRGGAIGDFILTLPAIRLLGEDLPAAEVEVMGYESIVTLARSGGYARRTRSIEYGAMAPFFARGAALDEALGQYFSSFDVVVSYLYDPDRHFRENLERVGVETLVECSHRVAVGGGPAAVQLAKPLESLALFLDADREAPRLALDGAAQAAAFSASHLAEMAGQRLAALHPGSGSPYKNWPLDRWRAVMERLWESGAVDGFLVSTGEAEEEAVTAFLKDLKGASFPVVLADRWPLPVLGAALASCWVYLGHDSGISHLAGSVGTPGVVLFGPTDSAVWAPPHRHVMVVEHPSGLLREIQVDEVVEAAVSHLSVQ